MNKETEHNLDLEQLRYIFELLTDGVYVIDGDYTVQYANSAFVREFGPYNDKTCYDYLCKGAEPCPECRFDDVLAGKTIRSEWHCAKTGKVYDTTDAPLKQPDGRLLKIKIIHDITEARASRQRIQDLSRFPDENPFPVLRLAADGTILYSNTPGRALLDKWRAEVGQTVPAQWRQVVTEALTSKRYQVQEVHCGSNLFSFAIAPVAEAGYVNLYGRDITKQKQIEADLRAGEERYRLLFDRNPDGVFAVDANGRFLQANPACEAISGYTLDELLGKTLLELCAPDQLAATVAHFKQSLIHRESSQLETALIRKDDRRVDLWITGEPIQTEDQEVIIYCTARDITERKQAEEKAQQEYHQTTLSNRILRVFVEYESDALFDKVLSIVQEGMASRHGVFGYIAEPGHLICPSLSKMLDACEIEGKCIHYPPEKWKGLWARALKEKRSFFTNEAPPVPPGHPVIHNNLAAPIMFHGEAIGLLNLANKDGGYTDQDLQTLERIAGRVAPMLYAWIQRKLREDERQTAEEALRESEQRLRLAAQAAEFGMYDADLVAGTLYWSPEFRQIVGLDADAPTPEPGRTPDFIHPDDIDSVREMLENAYDPNGDGEVDHEHRIIRPDGEIRWVLVQGQVEFGVIDGQRKAVRSTGIMLDITERKQAEASLRESEERYRPLFENMSEGFALHEILCDENGVPCDYRFLEINPSFERLTGLSRADLIGKPMRQVMPDNESYWVEVYGNVALTGEPAHVENFSSPLNRWYEVFAYRPAPGQFAVVFTDITERKLFEQTLRQSQEDLNRAQSVGAIGSWRLDVRENQLTWSDENYRIFGIPNGTPMTYETFLSTIHPDDREYVDTQWQAALKRWPYDIEHRIVVDGHVKWVREKAYLEFDEQGELVGGFGISQDITQRKQIEDQLRQARDELEHRVRQRTAELADTVATLEQEVRQRIKTEKALKESEENYRLLIDVSPEAVCVVVDERIVFSNAAALKLAGAERFEQLAGRFFRDFIHPDSKEIVSRDISEILSHHDKILSHEISLVRLDGDIIDVEVSETAVMHQGKLGLLAVYRDITERKSIQHRTRITNTLLELFTKKTSRKEYLDAVVSVIHEWLDCECVGIRLLDSEGKIPYESWIGFSQGFLSDESELSLYDNTCLCIRAITRESHSTDTPLVTGRGSFHSGNVQHFIGNLSENEKRCYRGNCMRHGFASLAVTPIRYRGTIIGAVHLADKREHKFTAESVAFLENIAMLVGEAVHRFNIEQSLQTSRRRLLEAQRIARIGNWEWDLKTGTLFWSDEIYRIIGVKPGDFEPTYDIFLSYVHPDDRHSIDEAVTAAKEQGNYAIDHRIIKPDGTVRYVHIIAEVTYNPQGEPLNMTGTIHDITEQKLAEQAIREHQQSLRAMAAELHLAEERQRRQIAQDLHDSIGPILAFSTRELKSLKKQASPALEAAMDDISQKIDKAIEQTRTLSFDLSPSLLYDLGLEVAIEDLTDRFSAKHNIHCRFQTCSYPKPLAEDRQIILYRSVRELLINAAKYANASLIQVSVSWSDSNICIRVEDDGKGFDPLLLKIEESEKPKGFGLFSIRERLTHIGGTMEIQSSPGQGTRIILTAPVDA